MLDNHFKKEEFKKSVKENVKMLYRKIHKKSPLLERGFHDNIVKTIMVEHSGIEPLTSTLPV